MKRATVYERRGRLILHADGKTTAGVFIGIEPFVVLDSQAAPGEIGAALRHVLRSSKDNLRHPQQDEWDAVAAPLYAAAGVKSWGTFVRGAVLTNVEADETRVRLIPHENLGPRDGFQPRSLEPIEVDAAVNDEELGSRVLNALSVARSADPHRL